MKNQFHASIAFAVAMMASVNHVCAQNEHKEMIVAAWERAKAYTKEYLDAATQEVYDFKPTSEIRSFAEQMQHLAVDNYGFVNVAAAKVTTITGYKDIENPPLKTKAEVTKAVMESYDFAIATIKSIDDSKFGDHVTTRRGQTTVEEILFKGFEHQTHHRGQCTIYLRLKGITPPPEKL